MARKKPAPKPVVTCPSCGLRADPSAGPLNFCPECGTDLRDEDAGSTSRLLHKVIADRYRLLALLGEGGMGAVYKAEHIRMGKALALKILRADFAREEGAVQRFRAEAQLVSRLSHPHTIAVFDFGEIEGGSGFYLAMEYVPGKDLAAVLQSARRLPEARIARIGAQILGSLAEAHDAGIVHRDMKPGNVMLMPTRSGDDFVKVLDFGIATLRDDPAGAGSTGGAAIVGTPNYLAPEQARGEAVDGRSDLYAVGCLLYELAAGHPPFRAPTAMAIVSAHLNQQPPPLAEQAPGISKELAAVIHRALAKKPDGRHASADAMADALLALAEPTGTRRLRRSSSPNVTGELKIASRDDFKDLDRHIRSLRQGRVLGPVTALLAAAAVAVGAWRWPDIYALAAARAPSVAALVPEALRPGGHFDGVEHEPNDVPSRATPLPFPAGPDGRPGAVAVRGSIGAKLSPLEGDIDVFELEIPPSRARKVLVAEWHGERGRDGIPGLDVSLALNRVVVQGEGLTAPLVAAANRGGAGRPERLVAAVEAGTYYLAVREVHAVEGDPVEKPADRYVLEVRLSDPVPGDEVEPNDGPDRSTARPERYPEWRALARRNSLGEAAVLHGETAADDPDVYGIEPGGPSQAPLLTAAIPAPGVALSARLWRPDSEDLAPSRDADRVRLEPAGDAGPGEVLLVSLQEAPREGAPAILELRAASGEGRYDLLALGEGASSGKAVLDAVRALAEGGRPGAALELAAGYASRLPRAAGRAEALLAAGRIAVGLAPSLSPASVRAHDRAAQLLGVAIFEEEAGKVVYRGAFEARAAGSAEPEGIP
jgi:eukaryotic-like serine/threonine-protein kinase